MGNGCRLNKKTICIITIVIFPIDFQNMIASNTSVNQRCRIRRNHIIIIIKFGIGSFTYTIDNSRT